EKEKEKAKEKEDGERRVSSTLVLPASSSSAKRKSQHTVNVSWMRAWAKETARGVFECLMPPISASVQGHGEHSTQFALSCAVVRLTGQWTRRCAEKLIKGSGSHLR